MPRTKRMYDAHPGENAREETNVCHDAWMYAEGVQKNNRNVHQNGKLLRRGKILCPRPQTFRQLCLQGLLQFIGVRRVQHHHCCHQPWVGFGETKDEVTQGQPCALQPANETRNECMVRIQETMPGRKQMNAKHETNV